MPALPGMKSFTKRFFSPAFRTWACRWGINQYLMKMCDCKLLCLDVQFTFVERHFSSFTGQCVNSSPFSSFPPCSDLDIYLFSWTHYKGRNLPLFFLVLTGCLIAVPCYFSGLRGSHYNSQATHVEPEASCLWGRNYGEHLGTCQKATGARSEGLTSKRSTSVIRELIWVVKT